MHARELLHNVLKESSSIGNKARQRSLINAVDSVVIGGGKLSLSSIGRNRAGNIKVKHKIKETDYLLGNAHLRKERISIYAGLSKEILRGLKEVTIIVDWSPAISKDNQILKASCAMPGRSLTLYEEIYPEELLGNYEVHKKFLRRLKAIIEPSGCKVTVITDAGFRTEWFNLVREIGWGFIGRIRSNMFFRHKESTIWESCRSEYKKATSKIKYYGEILLTKANELPCYMYLNKESNKKVNANKKKMSTTDKEYRRGAEEPWLLVSSELMESKKIIKTYKKRMQIEHEFRDTKDVQWGIGLSTTRSKDIGRLEILLLIGALAIFLLWKIGLITEAEKKHYDYQANTVRNKRILSLVYLGLQVIKHAPDSITTEKINNIFQQWRNKNAQ